MYIQPGGKTQKFSGAAEKQKTSAAHTTQQPQARKQYRAGNNVEHLKKHRNTTNFRSFTNYTLH